MEFSPSSRDNKLPFGEEKLICDFLQLEALNLGGNFHPFLHDNPAREHQIQQYIPHTGMRGAAQVIPDTARSYAGG